MKKLPIQIGLTVAVVALLPNIGLALSSSDFVILDGATANDGAGRAVASGDINGDGYDDLITGAPNNTTASITVTYGSSGVLKSATLSTSNSSIITGNGSADFFGTNIATGDINGDGYDDIAVSATGDTTGGAANSGAVYIIYGQADTLSSGALSSLTSAAKFYGGSGFVTGTALAVGNVNGDAYDDIAFGSSNDITPGTTGTVSIVYGSATNYTGSNSINDLPKFTAEALGDSLGSDVAIGDIDSDGYEDILMGAPSNDSGGDNAGAAYLIYGQSTNFSGSTSVSTKPELYGEAIGDNAGKMVAIGDATADGYNDLIVSATGNDDAAIDAGAVYIVSGSADQVATVSLSLNSSKFTQYTGEAAGDAIGNVAVFTATPAGDGIIAIGTQSAGSSAGAVYLIGTSATLTSGSLTTEAGLKISGNGTESFGRSVSNGDLNGDQFPELLVGANTYSTAGAAMVGYLYIDADLDGLPGTDGLLSGIDSGATYDTNDTIPNNGVEINDDGIDNDGDGVVDEVNTLAENGAHPYYSTLDPTDSAAVATNITKVTAVAAGAIEVTYADNSTYSYTVYTTTTTKLTKAEQYDDTGYAVAIHRKGKNAKLVNLYTGAIADSQRLNKKAVTKASLLLGDVRKDGKTEAIVTTKKRAKVKVFLLKVKVQSGTLKLKDTAAVINKKIDTAKTQVKKSTIRLRSSKNKVLETLTVNKKYTFVD